MSPYRQSPNRVHAIERCEVCGLVIRVEPIPEDLSFALETIWVLTRHQTHGDHPRCPGPPRLALVPWWRAVLELFT